MSLFPFIWLIGWGVFLFWFENQLKKRNKCIIGNGIIFMISSFFFYPAWFCYYRLKGF